MVDQMAKNQRVVVIGAGLAGSTAAARAAQLGCEVTLIDLAPDATAGGNTAMSGGGVHVTAQDLRSDPGVLRNRVLGQGWGHTRLPLVDAFLSNAPHAHRWLTRTGVRFQSRDAGSRDSIPADTFLDPKRDMADVHAWPDRGPQQALRTIQDALRRAGGTVVESTPGRAGRDAHNAAAAGRTGELPVLRSRNALVLDGELLAFPVVAGITFTMGGVSIDAKARVLDADATPIPGLLAAGGAAAGPTAGYIGGLATALIFGYIAGTTLAAG
jgi:succinate dehydrogenase/fumarate reductase flavoprotein subunit